MPLVYVKKWMQTKYALLFRLSNRIVQVDFTDKTRIILSPSNQIICYKKKKGEVSTHNLETAMEADYPEMVKRLKYAKEILSYLKNHGQKDENRPIDDKARIHNYELRIDTMNVPTNLKGIFWKDLIKIF